MMNAKTQQIVESTPIAPPVQMSETAALISMIERAARDPSVDIDKFERLMKMRVQAEERNARMAYSSALSAMQPTLPQVDRKGNITIIEKGGTKVVQSTPYALWEDINTAIGPKLAEHGFALSFRTGTTTEGKITVTAILSHREGHQEETTMVLTHDSTGSKNAVQAIGSSISYGKRYTAGLLLNITSRAPHEADDDGKKAADPVTITQEEALNLLDLIADVKANLAIFLKYYQIEKVQDLPAAKLSKAIAALENKRAKQ